MPGVKEKEKMQKDFRKLIILNLPYYIGLKTLGTIINEAIKKQCPKLPTNNFNLQKDKFCLS